MRCAQDGDKLWQPATFLERGVGVPFTTPVLAGTRARAAESGVDLLVPNPSGGRGVYIMGWADLAQFCTPTLHDTLMCERVARLAAITPRDIRHAARAVAADGTAGRPARLAAAAASKADEHERLMANYQLMQLLVTQIRGAPAAPATLDREARAAIVAASGQLARPAQVITTDIETLADLYVVPGFGASAESSRCARLLGSIACMQTQLRQLACSCRAETSAVTLVMSSADVTLQLARRMLSDARARLGDMVALLGAWGRDAAGTAAQISRTEWMLDGWEEICLVWQLAPAERWRAAVSEMALMVPVIPQEATEWWAAGVDNAELQRLRRQVHGYEDWRTGSLVIDLVARNERMRALAA